MCFSYYEHYIIHNVIISPRIEIFQVQNICIICLMKEARDILANWLINFTSNDETH